ncbi:hypothetical protein [Streptosporangium roseum]|uniref:Uncharacterized protein n=1 Tax=Streptosporangium roseum (strain ATCC 12428 / DSM 43021 / JCM 3005 / KCTC 9067 / NCIMB 10171 / NRRL 2505 / NI 9100) TaxID=479432 RepID=D2B0C6_STRRD|nr:hypothetical protein [Streptosporangium roseum]ACZ89132.1 hypothetical protein Sros_6418 [Streptosporangium roseum DSM 43021]
MATPPPVAPAVPGPEQSPVAPVAQPAELPAVAIGSVTIGSVTWKDIRVGSLCPPMSPCATVKCGPGHICVPSPEKCSTTPCPQYDCVSMVPLPMQPAPASGPVAVAPPAGNPASLPM